MNIKQNLAHEEATKPISSRKLEYFESKVNQQKVVFFFNVTLRNEKCNRNSKAFFWSSVPCIFTNLHSNFFYRHHYREITQFICIFYNSRFHFFEFRLYVANEDYMRQSKI